MGEKQDSFLGEVIKHIKSKEAKKYVRAELEYHLKEAKEMWIAKGHKNLESENKAVEQMGSPIHLGQKLNKLHQPRVDWWMMVLIVITMGFSFMPILSLWGMEHYDLYYNLRNKIMFAILGLVVVFVMMMIDYKKMKKLGWVFYVIGILIPLILLAGIGGLTVNGEPILRIGPLSLRSLIAIPFLFLAWASFLNDSKLKFWKLNVLFLVPLLLFLEVGNLPVAFIYLCMGFAMLWYSNKLNIKKALIMTIVPIIFGGLYFWYTVKEYQLNAFSAFLKPENFATDGGYMYLKLRELISSAGWLGSSGQEEFIQYGYASQTDFVLVSLILEYGYLFAILLVLILSLFAARMIVIAYRIKDQFAKLLLVGGITLYAVQFVYNVSMILGFVPITSMSLPFISYGFIPTLFNALIMGIVLSIYRRRSFIMDYSNI
ncbi:FtsW/RodA/SpoVE family cell cycle protein [Oceanobacillus sp. CAU 1775]